MQRPAPPQSIDELVERYRHIAGLSVAELAGRFSIKVPPDLRHHKGWLGDLIELALGTSAASKSEPDFTELGIELKTLPLNTHGSVQESTWVCSVPMQQTTGLRWQDSCVYHKLHHVLWLPVEADASIPLGQRHIGNGLLWQADDTQLVVLRADWEELMELVAMGQYENISARHGEYLQIRPKAANAKVLCTATGPDGSTMQTLPRGFYLRTEFTNALLKKNYLISS